MKNRKGLKLGQYVACQDKNMPSHLLTSGKVTKFYPLNDGGEGVTIDNSSQPIEHLLNIRFFNTREEMLGYHNEIYNTKAKSN